MILFKELIFACFIRNLVSFDYCGEKKHVCKPGVKHVGCAADMLAVREVTSIPHTKKFIDIVKFEHDKIRNSVACGVYQTSRDNKEKYPKAAKMKALQWDYELAYLSKQITTTCDESFEFHYCFESARFPPIAAMSYFSFRWIKLTNTSMRNPIRIIKRIIRNWPKAEVGPKDKVIAEEKAVKPSPFYYTDFYSMIGDHENGTKFACTFSYCPDSYERDAFRKIFICLYSWKYTQDNIVYETGDAGDNCKADPDFQCLCAGGFIPKVSIYVVVGIFCCLGI